MNDCVGTAYILKNESIPEFIKIGFTSKDDLAARICELNKSPMPLPYEIYFAAKVPEIKKLESTIELLFSHNRAGRKREFFEIKPDLPKAVIELVAETEIELSDEEQEIEPGERRKIDLTRASRHDILDVVPDMEWKPGSATVEVLDADSPVICVKRA